MNKKPRELKLKEAIEKACIKHGLNLTVYKGSIAFVDQANKKIVALWNPSYTLEEVNDDKA